MNEPLPVVTDAGPLIHLDELGCLDLLTDVGIVTLPPLVWAEVRKHRPELGSPESLHVQIEEPADSVSPSLATLVEALDLQEGEIAALNLLEGQQRRMFLTDDAAARLAAESLGVPVHGTIGLIVRSIRRRTRSQDDVVAILQSIPERTSLHISRDLLRTVIDQVRGAR